MPPPARPTVGGGMQINGYELDDLISQVFSHYERFTATSIKRELDRLHSALNEVPGPLFISLGENCGPGLRLRAAGAQTLGSQFFDNLVVPIGDVSNVIRQGFSDILQIKNLSIGVWEGQDSVIDNKYNTFYHHYFHLLPMEKEKKRDDNGVSVRRIDEADIPLFIPVVRAQFEYLAEKFIIIAGSPVRKNYVLRKVDGTLPTREEVLSLREAIVGAGGVNFRIVIIHSEPHRHEEARALAACDPNSLSVHCIEERAERWGDVTDWQGMVQREVGG